MTDFRAKLVYRLLPISVWKRAQLGETLPFAVVDQADGYYHLSSAEQVLETARLYYQEFEQVIAAGFDPKALGDKLKWETSRGGDLFPHYYAKMPVSAIVHALRLHKRNDDAFVIVSAEDLPS